MNPETVLETGATKEGFDGWLPEGGQQALFKSALFGYNRQEVLRFLQRTVSLCRERTEAQEAQTSSALARVTALEQALASERERLEAIRKLVLIPVLILVLLAGGWAGGTRVAAAQTATGRGSLTIQGKVHPLTLDKFVSRDAEDYDTRNVRAAKSLPVAGGAAFTWTLVFDVPDCLATMSKEELVVSDSLPVGVDYVPGSAAVCVGTLMTTPHEQGRQLTEGRDYTLSYAADKRCLRLSFTEAGRTNVARNYFAASAERAVIVRYQTRLNRRFTCGVDVSGSAELSYTAAPLAAQSAAVFRSGSEATTGSAGDGSVTLGLTPASEPVVHTGRVVVEVVDAHNHALKLKGARLRLSATKADARAGSYLASGSSDSRGCLSFRGLRYGQAGDSAAQNTAATGFWLTEIRAPKGYRRLTTPVKVSFAPVRDTGSSDRLFARVVLRQDRGFAPLVKAGDNTLWLPLLALLLPAALLLFLVSRSSKDSDSRP